MPLIALGVVVSCGRIGFDLEPDPDAAQGINPSGDAPDSLDSGETDAPQSSAEATPSPDGPAGGEPLADAMPGDAPPSDVSSGGEPQPDVSAGDAPQADVVASDAPQADALPADASSSDVAQVDGSPPDAGSGSCAPPCTNAHGTTSCVSGVCAPVCAAGYGDCDGDLTNGCEAKLDTVSNCGMCGKVCTADAGMPACIASTCTTTCDLTGRWAAKLTVPLTWPSGNGLAAGSGALVVWMMLDETQNGNSVATTITPCGTTISDDMSAGGELYGLTLPNALFDHIPPYLSIVATTMTLGGSQPGSTFSVPPFALLFGMTMTNPTTDPWPATPQTVMQVDMDQDTKPAVTLPYKTGGSYKFPAVNGSASVRADRSYLAARVAASSTGSITSCTSLSGSATIDYFNSHVLGCRRTTGVDCIQAESDFIDTHSPVYVIGSATMNMVNVAAASTCANVRSAL